MAAVELPVTLTGLCTEGLYGPLLWLHDGTALAITCADDLSEYHDFVVVAVGLRLAELLVVQSITSTGERAATFFRADRKPD